MTVNWTLTRNVVVTTEKNGFPLSWKRRRRHGRCNVVMVMRQCDDHCETVGRSGETVGRLGETVGRSASLWDGRQVCQGSGDVVRRLGRCQGAGTLSGGGDVVREAATSQ